MFYCDIYCDFTVTFTVTCLRDIIGKIFYNDYKIKKLERQIDRMVYQLYGLMEKIEIVEGRR